MNWPRQAGQQQPKYTEKRIYFLSNNYTLFSRIKQVSELNEVKRALIYIHTWKIVS